MQIKAVAVQRPDDAAMIAAMIARYDRRVPRYTSYPTAPHFTPAVGTDAYRRWLGALDARAGASLYLHVPFCREMCWYCGCNTRVVRHPEPIAAYVDSLIVEIDQVADTIPERLAVNHIHFGGGSPNTLAPSDLIRLLDRLRRRFDVAADAEIAIEIDPRATDDAFVRACAEAGITRASIGVQDLNADVQLAVNRIQPFELIRHVVDSLAAAGVTAFNVDLMYGLPRQTAEKVVATVDQTLELVPSRVALFGYAHVPWMKKHMRLIDESTLPDARERWRQFERASERLLEAGYVAIGMDHFAQADDPLARAALAGTLHRNFQGYTTDTSPLLLGFGASAIGRLPDGYVQNDADVPGWRKAVAANGLAVVRGRALNDDDRVRRAIIERLMCDMAVDVDAVARDHGCDAGQFSTAFAALQSMAQDGLVEISGTCVHMTPIGRPLVRAAAAAFDAYLDAAPDAAPKHARAL